MFNEAQNLNYLSISKIIKHAIMYKIILCFHKQIKLSADN